MPIASQIQRLLLILALTLLVLVCDVQSRSSAVTTKTWSDRKEHEHRKRQNLDLNLKLPIHTKTNYRKPTRDDEPLMHQASKLPMPRHVHFPLMMFPMIQPLSRLLQQNDTAAKALHAFNRGMNLLKRSNKILTTAGIASCALGCHMLITHPTRAHAHTKDAETGTGTKLMYNPHAKKIGKFQILTRAGCFWWRAGPIIAHYKVTQAWVNVRYRKLYSGDNANSSSSSSLDEVLRREKRDEIYDKLHDKYASTVLDLLLDMRGLFIKIGQVVSSRPDFIPRQYIDCLSTLQDDVPPWDAGEIKQIVADSLGFHHDLHDLDKVFSHFDDRPIGSASIGQVHRATLTDEFLNEIKSKSRNRRGGYGYNTYSSSSSSTGDKSYPIYVGGREVAVKVMHLDAEDRFRNDLKIFRWLCRVALPGWGPILSEFEKQIMTEFDYLNEASNLQSVRDNMLASPYRNQVVVPAPLMEYSTPNVLIMEYLDGVKLAQAVEEDLAVALRGDRKLAKLLIDEKRAALFNGTLDLEQSPMEEMKNVLSKISDYTLQQKIYTMMQLAILRRKQKKAIELLLDVHGHQILVDGKFNGDCHPGNVLSLSCGKLGLIDYGQCKTLEEHDRESLRNIVSHLGSPDVDENEVANAMINFGFSFQNDDKDIIRQTANLFFDSDAERRGVGCATTQEYLMYLQARNPFESVPDAAVFVARTSFLFRGLGSLLGLEVRTSQQWAKHAKKK